MSGCDRAEQGVIAKLPTPLAREYCIFREEHDCQETDKYLLLRRLIDTTEVLVKLYTVAMVSQFAAHVTAALEKHLPRENSRQLNIVRGRLAEGLSNPTLGIWWNFAQKATGALQLMECTPVLPGAHEMLLGKGPLAVQMSGKGHNLVALRNDIAHGGIPGIRKRELLLTLWEPVLRSLVEGATPLMEATLIVADEVGEVFTARGLELKREDHPPANTEPGRCYMKHPDGTVVDLHPLLVYRPVNEPQNAPHSRDFYFYNKRIRRLADVLNYPGDDHQRDQKEQGHLDGKYLQADWAALGELKDEIQREMKTLSSNFMGRSEELQRLADFIDSPSRRIMMVWGNPGMGKSALLARLAQLLQARDGQRHDLHPGIRWPDAEIKVVYHRLTRDGAPSRDDICLSLIGQLDLIMPPGRSQRRDSDLSKRLRTRIREVSAGYCSSMDKRLVLIVDGLDMGADTPGLLDALPRTVPEGVRLILSARNQRRLRYGFYDQIDPPEIGQQYTLGGMSPQDTQLLLQAHVNKYALDPGGSEALQLQQQTAGNPLILTLICQELEENNQQPQDISGYPKRLEELYEGILHRLSNQENGAATLELLQLLAAARGYLPLEAIRSCTNAETIQAVEHGPLARSLELVEESPSLQPHHGYKLFHESLREYLIAGKRASDVHPWEEKLADWCSQWMEDGKPRHAPNCRWYAMACAVPHLEALRHGAMKHEQQDIGDKYARRMLKLVEDRQWRTECYRSCGEMGPLRQAIRIAQRALDAHPSLGDTLARKLRMARWMTEELGRHREENQAALFAPPHTRNATDRVEFLKRVAKLADIGSTPAEKIMLALAPLWIDTNLRETIPDPLQIAIESWEKQSAPDALAKLRKLTINT